MAGGLDTEMAAQFLTVKLTGAAGLTGLTVVDGGADSTIVYPFVNFEYIPTAPPVQNPNGVYILGKPRYRVKVHGRNVPFSTLRPYKLAIYNAIHMQQFYTATSGQVYACVCKDEVKEEEDVNGVRYRRLGYDVEITGRSGV